MVQCLKLHLSSAGGTGLISGWGNKIQHTTCPKEKKKKNGNNSPHTHVSDSKFSALFMVPYFSMIFYFEDSFHTSTQHCAFQVCKICANPGDF